MRNEFRPLFKLALPLILAQVAQNSLSFIDTVMVGRLGNEALASIALGGTFFFVVQILLSGVLIAVGPMVSQAHGAGDKLKAARSVRQGLALAIVVGIVALLLLSQAERVLLALGQDPAIVEQSARYLRAISWGLLPALLMTAVRGFFEGLSNTRPIMFFSFAALGLNVLANNALIFGNWGFPELGLVGSGYASAFVYTTSFVMIATYARWRYKDYGLFSRFKPDLSMMRELARIGIPIGLMLGFEAGMFSSTYFLMGLLGAQELAAHQIAMQTASVTFMIPLGLSIATSVRVGQAIGRGDNAAARTSGFTGMLLCAAVMCFTATLFMLFPEQIISLYLDTSDTANASVVQLATSFLIIAGMFQIFDGLQVSAAGALRGLKDTRIPMIITLIAYWLIGIGSSILLAFRFNLGGQGLWFGLVFGLAAAGIALGLRFNSLSRKWSAKKPLTTNH